MFRSFDSLVERYLDSNTATGMLFNEIITRGSTVTSGSSLVDEHIDPMIQSIYNEIEYLVGPGSLSEEEARLYIGELSVFARYNSTFLLRSADIVRPVCPELAQEFMRNYLEEAGERGKLPAHYVLFSGALASDLGFRVNGWMPRAQSTLSLTSLIDVLSWSHCPSTMLGMYYATEAVATAETLLLRSITDRLGHLLGRGTGDKLPRLNYYYRMHLDDSHEAATAGVAVEQGHQEGIAYFIRNHELFGFLQPQILDGFLQMLNPFVDQWVELASLVSSKRAEGLSG